LAKNAKYNGSELARLCGVSTRQLQRHFRRWFRQTPQRWLDDRRLIAAQQWLLQGESIKTIAIDLGFKHPSHFCHQFKRRNKMTPTQFVKMRTQNVAPTQQMSLTVN
jgi:AraC-like DNA-binding protein